MKNDDEATVQPAVGTPVDQRVVPLVEKLRNACTGYDEWRVQDPKDGSYCIAFNWREVMNPERMAREWLADHCRRFPGGLHSDFVVACVRVQTQADELMQEAADALELARRATVTAQPLEWEPHGDGDWADKFCGFYISHAPDDDADAPYHAAWGEGDNESFATLDEAKAWCQREIDTWVRRFAVVTPNVELSGRPRHRSNDD